MSHSFFLLLLLFLVLSRTKSPLSAHFAPDIVKEPSVKLTSRVSKDKIVHHETIEEKEMNDEDNSHTKQEKSQSAVNGTEVASKPTPYNLPNGASPSQLEGIIQHQKKEEQLLEEQHELLQKKLLHDYDHYIRDLGSAQEKKVDLEMVNGDVALKDNRKPVQPSQDSKKTVQPAPVGTYDLFSPEVIPSYSIMYSGSNNG